MKAIIKLFLLLTFFSNQIKAQDDSNCGIYIDGAFVDKVDCWTFNYMYLIFPVNPEKYKKYQMIEVKIRAYWLTKSGEIDGNTVWVREFSPETFSENFGTGKYGVWKLLTDKNNDKAFYTKTGGTGYENFTRKDFAKQKDAKYEFTVTGYISSGWGYDEAGQRIALYDRTAGAFLYKSEQIPAPQCKKCPWDINTACAPTGKKVELKVEKSPAYKDEYGIIK